MAAKADEAANLLSQHFESDRHRSSRSSIESVDSVSTTSLVLERIGERVASNNTTDLAGANQRYDSPGRHSDTFSEGHYGDLAHDDEEKTVGGLFSHRAGDMRMKRGLWIVAGLVVGIWLLAAAVYTLTGTRERPEHDHAATSTIGSGKKITLDQVLRGNWRAVNHHMAWIEGANGEDGLLLKRAEKDKDYLVVEDVRSQDKDAAVLVASKTLIKEHTFRVNGETLTPAETWPSKDLKKVLIATSKSSNWRHSFYALYWIFDVATQTAEPLDPKNTNGRVQLASWSPQSDAIVFTRNNNMFLRKLSSPDVIQITKDGGSELFYGIPDWVYEEEVFAGNSATWWAEDGNYVAFLKTDESKVPEYPIEYFLSRPSGKRPATGLENYPEVRQIKYPKAGAPNPVVHLNFYDIAKGDVFEVKISDEFGDDDRLITEVIWAGSSGKVLIKETNRESYILRVVLVDAKTRTGKTVRTTDVDKLDGGWFEISEHTTYVPADPANGRPDDGYIDTVIHENYDHLAYFTPLDSSEPKMITSGDWEVVTAPAAVDLANNLVYFVATKESAIQRHIYSVKLDGTELQAVSDTSKEGYYGVSFSSKAGYVLLSYEGPSIPWQMVLSTRSNPQDYKDVIESNKPIAELAKKHEMPIKIYSVINIDGFDLNIVERRPPHFSEKKKYPVLFWMYNGPASQQVNKKFTVDFQSYIAASLGYIVVTLDGRGTGFMGRKTRCIVRDNLGYYETYDQIEAAKTWSKKKYVDASRMAIWGWSYGGFMTLKTLERDAGETFKYGMAVAPVTDWRFYDSIYTERYMHTPQNNQAGYENSSISDVKSLSKNVRFLVMHGIADDNVHMQSTMTLLDKLDMGGVENYDVHVFPDSDHSIYFHNANRIVYDSKFFQTTFFQHYRANKYAELNNWLINAFNGEYLGMVNAVPKDNAITA